MDMVCYGKAWVKFCETLLARYRNFYKNMLKKYAKIKMARNVSNFVFVVKSVLLSVLTSFCLLECQLQTIFGAILKYMVRVQLKRTSKLGNMK